MGFSRQESWSGCYALLQGTFLTQGSNACFLHLLQWQVSSLPLAPAGKPLMYSSNHHLIIFAFNFLSLNSFSFLVDWNHNKCHKYYFKNKSIIINSHVYIFTVQKLYVRFKKSAHLLTTLKTTILSVINWEREPEKES